MGLLIGAAAVWWLRVAGMAAELDRHRLAAQLATDQANAAQTQLAATKAEFRGQLHAAQTELAVREEAAAAREQLLARRDEELREAFRSLSAEALAGNNRAFVELAEHTLKQATATLAQKADGDAQQHKQAVAALTGPLAQAVEKLDSQLRVTEKEREGAYRELNAQVGHMRSMSQRLEVETRQLVTALRAPQARGRWGELQLERIVELAGMVEHCDFSRQVTATGRTGEADTTIRPDMVVRLAGGKEIVVDAKVSLAAYLEAAEADDEATQQRRLSAHARHLRNHVDSLASKSYWAAFDNTPELVVLFIPGDSFLQAALTADPALLEHAFEHNVVIATPTTLIALLRTVAHTWRQEALTRNAADVLALGRELHERLRTMGDHVSRLGRSLTSSVDAYNRTVGALESRVLVTARKLTDLRVTDDDLATPDQVERVPRVLQAPELTTAVDENEILSLLERPRLRAYGMRDDREDPGGDAPLRATVNE